MQRGQRVEQVSERGKPQGPRLFQHHRQVRMSSGQARERLEKFEIVQQWCADVLFGVNLEGPALPLGVEPGRRAPGLVALGLLREFGLVFDFSCSTPPIRSKVSKLPATFTARAPQLLSAKWSRYLKALNAWLHSGKTSIERHLAPSHLA